MRIIDTLVPGKPSFSLEFFPPKTPEGWRGLWRTIAELRAFEPRFVSVTYGAGGSERGRTIEAVTQIKREYGIEAMAHLTCVGHSRAELGVVLEQLRAGGIENVIALRGDPPKGTDEFVTRVDGCAHASELLQLIRDQSFDFCLAAAAYPEMHPESQDRATDLAHLRLKVEMGASYLITQLFFDNAFYFDFVERARRAGITVPIIPGIMPIVDVAQIRRFTSGCGATIPARLENELQRCDTPEAALDLGVRWATAQCAELLERGVPGIHFYTLNRSPATGMVLQALG
jgi:methylenetetrahydrofolate reductase (NADPH)